MKKLIILISSLFLIFSYNLQSQEKVETLNRYGSCSEASYCADGYTILGIDRFGNKRGYIYPQREITKEDYKSRVKIYDNQGYDEFGFDREGIDKNNKHYNEIKIMVNTYE